MRNSGALRPRWQVVAWACAALAFAGGLALIFFAEPASEVRHAQVSATKPPAQASEPAAPAPETPAPPAIASVPAPVPVAPPTAPRAKAFPAVVVDASAEILYNRLASSEVTLDQAGEVAKLHKALEPCWMASLYERMALLVPPDSDPKGHAMAQRLAREQGTSGEQLAEACDLLGLPDTALGAIFQNAQGKVDPALPMTLRTKIAMLRDWGSCFWS